MSGNGNGNRSNGNGIVKKAWNLKKDGILWKKVTEYSTKEFQALADALVAQLQESIQPADALQGVLLDRIAANYLRKRLLLEIESMSRLSSRVKDAGGSLSKADIDKPKSISVSLPLQCYSPNLLRYEALLDQGFHRDLILLEKLKEIALVPQAKGRSPKADRPILDGETEQTHTA
ncbi:MAG: hypothetical protein WA485_15085 [Candidatus Sulfotelmatobacter sp.]